jgi:hypothetical protein
VRTIIYGCTCLTALCQCRQPNEFTEKQYILASGDSVYVRELKISIHNKGCSMHWISEKDKPSYETAYCDLDVRHGNEQVQYLNNNEPVYAGEAEVTIGKINPWGTPKDSLPACNCNVTVKKVAGTHR